VKAFKRSRDGLLWRCSANEVRLLESLVEQFVELVDPPHAADTDDPLSVLQGEMEADPLDRDDPAIERLFPSAYRSDEAAAEEFRSLTEASMRRAKAADARIVLADLADVGDGVAIAKADVDAWLRTTNGLRIVLGARLGIETAALSEVAENLPEDHPAYAAVEIYQWLGYVQTAMLDAL